MAGVPQLIADLRSGDEERAEQASQALAQTGAAGAAALARLIESPSADDRWWAIRTLAGFETVEIAPFLPAFADPVPDVRAAAALAIAAHPDEAAIPGLVTLLSDEDNLAAVLAVSALVKIGETSVPALISAFDGAPPRGQIQILRALAELRDHRAIPLLLAAQGKDSAVMQYWAQQGLENLGLDMVYLGPE